MWGALWITKHIKDLDLDVTVASRNVDVDGIGAAIVKDIGVLEVVESAWLSIWSIPICFWILLLSLNC